MKYFKISLFFLVVLFFLFWLYCSSLIGVQKEVKNTLKTLRSEIKSQGFQPSFFVISGRRWHWDNWLLNQLGGAAKKSKHLSGLAIDIIILDVNQDGKMNANDVDIVRRILDKKIIKNKGGLGTYKNESGFFNRQMIHFDLRGKSARWNR